MGDKIVEIRVQMSSKKSSENRHPKLVILGSIFGGPFWDHLGDKIDEIGFQIGGEKK